MIHGIEAVIGRTAFEALCRHYGGLDLHIPQSMDTQTAHHLADTIGQEATEALIAWGASSRVYVPRLQDVELQKRREDIVALRRGGMSVSAIAKCYRFQAGYTERQLFTLLSRHR